MVQRKARKPVRRAKKRAFKKRAPRPDVSANQKAHWKTYQSLQKRIDKAWVKLQSDVKKKAGPQALLKDRNQLLLLLGECNYMIQQCTNLSAK